MPRTAQTFITMLAFALLSAGLAHAKLGPKLASFEVITTDDQGGGWVINHLPGLGDRLWGCADVAKVEECKQVYLEKWMPASSISFFHVTKDTQRGWMNLSIPIYGDLLFACHDPETEPKCMEVELDVRPPGAGLAREWPAYDLDHLASAGGGGLMGGLMGGDSGPTGEDVVEPASKSDMWLSAALKLPGPVNLYACRNLNSSPECQLSIPDMLLVDREAVGFKKIELIESKVDQDGEPLMGIYIEEVEEESAAEYAKMRAGDVIVRVGGFPIKTEAHFRALLAQYPATYEMDLELESGEVIVLRVLRKPPKEEKKR